MRLKPGRRPVGPDTGGTDTMTSGTGGVAGRGRAGEGSGPFPMGFAEFVVLVGLSMAVSALSIDIMLVALPDIAREFSLTDANDRQFVLTAYLVAYAAGHIVAGPLSDRIGRRPVLLGGLAVYVAGALAAALAQSFEILLAARIVQGLGGSGPRVVGIAIVRDRFSGRPMARVMSFAMTMFIMVPVIAPSIGSLILFAGPWPLIFWFLVVVGIALAAWIGLRLPETNPATVRAGAERIGLARAFMIVVGERQTLGYTIAIGFVFSTIITYIATAQQVFSDVFGVVETLPIFFAIVAACQAGAAFLNANLVERFGMRRLSHAALLVSLVASGLVVALLSAGVTLALFPALVWMATVFFCVGLTLPNFNAIAMEPLGRVAGMGSSLIGFYMTGAGTLLGTVVGQLYGGTLMTVATGYLLYSAAAILAVLATERGRLFEARSGQ